MYPTKIKNDFFSITEEENQNFSEITIKNEKTGEHLIIIPEYGGRVKELWLNNGGKIFSLLKKVERIDSKNRDDIFTNVKLSPFAGRIKNGQYAIGNDHYNLPLNYPEEKNACHGFVFDKNFSVLHKEATDDYALCSLRYFYDNEVFGYPFRYSIVLTYKLSVQEGLTCTTNVLNYSQAAIPLNDGWHFYFDLDEEIDNLMLKLNVSEILELDSKNLPNGNKHAYSQFLSPSLINNQHFDSCFKVKGNNSIAVTQLISGKNNLAINMWQDVGIEKYNYIVIYTPPNRKSIALEPMTSNINSFNNKEGLVLLLPNTEFESSFGITVGNKTLFNNK